MTLNAVWRCSQDGCAVLSVDCLLCNDGYVLYPAGMARVVVEIHHVPFLLIHCLSVVVFVSEDDGRMVRDGLLASFCILAERSSRVIPDHTDRWSRNDPFHRRSLHQHGS